MTDDKKTKTSTEENKTEWKANKGVLMKVLYRKRKYVGRVKHEQKQQE